MKRVGLFSIMLLMLITTSAVIADDTDEAQDDDDRVAVIEGLSGPEAVHWDAEQEIWFVRDGEAEILIQTPGRPADIGLDASGRRLAVPYIALDRVDLWNLPDRS